MQYATHDHVLICELAKELAPYKIAKKFEISADEVKRICALYGVKVIGKHKPSTMKMRILELKEKGWRQIDIARELNTDDSVVRKYLWEAGIKSGVTREKSAESIRKARQVDMLRRDGMTAQDACNAVGNSLNSYYLYRERKPC